MMNRRWIYFAGMLLLAITTVIVGCATEGEEGPVGPAGPPGPQGPPGPAGDPATASQTYVGSGQCGACHEETYNTFILSGHPYELTKIEGGQPPSFPYDQVTGGVMEPPEGYTWDDVSYVIGGFGWKAQFIDNEGFIITGDENATTQYNFANEAVGTEANWVPYHAGETRSYDCGACHTTGYIPDGHQDDLEGIIGTWAFPGIQCEACHGPGSRHAEDPYGVRMVVEFSSQLCSECHVRDNPAIIESTEGFVRHEEQYEELFSSKHFSLSCITCHEPHSSVVYEDPDLNPDRGLRQTCDTCHWQQRYQNNRKHRGVDCTDCHMPPMVKSAVANLDTFTGDLRSHLYSINPNPDAPQFNEDETASMPYITLEYACMHCHNDEIATVKEMAELADMASGYHTPPEPTPTPTPEPVEAEPTATPTATPSS